jgi:hypothetical protein
VHDIQEVKAACFRAPQPPAPAGPAVFNQFDYDVCARKIGKLSLFNPMKCDDTKYVADLTIHEERFIVKLIVMMADKEEGDNLIDCRFGSGENNMNPGFEIPMSWKVFIPLTGHFSTTYVCNEKDIKVPFRRKLWNQYFKFEG